MATPDELDNNNDECAICWEKMESARKLECGHLFHKYVQKYVNSLQEKFNGLFALLDTDSDSDPGTDINPKMGTETLGDLDPDWVCVCAGSVQCEQFLYSTM